MKELLNITLSFAGKLVLPALFGLLGLLAKKLIDRFVDTVEKKQIVEATVLYVEQVSTAIHGAEKLNKAIERAAELCREKGIKTSPEELQTLVEACVARFNKAFDK